ncbi:MAG: CotH kinase family protein [Candidatus Marinimicrobia bacterium]|nr:CotH kinase family protein [Candidatus Neomarinimicrobiota bacterium]MCF7850392.1 CotH kinase family protein [Candidatus Neomarinimicrobiota bacterium]
MPFLIWGQTLKLNEVVSSNQYGIRDEDGDTPDWIEIYNQSASTIDLSGYGLSDDPLTPLEWVFTGGELEAGGYEVVYASDKNRHGQGNSWQVLLQEGAAWKYVLGNAEPPSAWNSLGFDASSWASGSAGIGYGDDDDNTVISNTVSLYMRREFNIPNPHDLAKLLFHIDYDDGYIAYINGVEFSRANMGEPGSVAYHNTLATTYTEPVLPFGGSLPPILIPQELIRDGGNVISIQVHNSSSGSSDLTALPFLSLGVALNAGSNLPSYLELPPASRNHTNFKIASEGETLFLTSRDGTDSDSMTVPSLPVDISYGRDPDGAQSLKFFSTPSPGLANTNGFDILAKPPTISPSPGFYTGSVSIDPGSIPAGLIYTYTLDGSEPSPDDPTFNTPVTLYETSALRVLVSNPDGSNQHRSSYTYFINVVPDLPVISLIFEPDDFFAEDTGMYVMGPNASSSFPYFGANFWQDWERQIHLEYFADESGLSYAAGGGAKIFGGWSRGNAQRSLALFARSEYGAGEFDFPFFSDQDLDSYEALVLRNSGNDWQNTGLRDGVLTGLVSERDIDKQAFQAVEVYFNGDYWGIYNLREKVNEHFVAGHYAIDADDVDLLQADNEYLYPDDWFAIHGEAAGYLALVDFISNNDLSDPLIYEYVQERIDIQNLIDYQVSQIYFNNRDWPGNNVKLWRRSDVAGKWRWILYDTDFGFGIWNTKDYELNTFEFAADPNGPGWPNPPWSTLLLRKLLTNADFRRDFILTTCDLLNDPFVPATVNEAITYHKEVVYGSIPEHFQRWNHNNLEYWNSQIDNMRTFAFYRQAFMRSHLKKFFNLGDIKQLTVNIDQADMGSVRIHTLTPEDYPWSGQYFAGVPLDLEALPKPGYVFSHWEGSTSTERSTSLPMNTDTVITAHFIPATENREIVINEINYHSPSSDDSGDWLELFNASGEEINLIGWGLQDANDDNLFMLGDSYLEPGGYLVLCHDTTLFRNVHGAVPRIVGNFDFNLSNAGELVRLYDHDGLLVDSVRYDDTDPWPLAADGTGPTLELLHYKLDNGDVRAWASSDGLGSPGMENSQFTVSTEPQLASIPERLNISRAFPNPTNASITISYELPDPGPVDIQIFNLRGALIYSSVIEQAHPGRHNFIWDGKFNDGVDASSGMYILRISQNQQHDNTKFVIIR